MSNFSFLSFCSIPDLEDNSPKTISALGELSTRAKTYAKYPAVYKNDTSLSLIVTFDGTKDDAYTAMSTDLRDRFLKIYDWIYGKGEDNTFTNDKVAALQLISSQFTDNITFSAIGDMVTNARIFLPGYIEGTITNNGDSIYFKTWFSNDAFLSEYPKCDIQIILPVDDNNFDLLGTGNYQQINTALAGQTQDVIEKRVTSVTTGIPYTDRLIFPYAIVDTINNQSVLAYFIAIVNGNSGDSSDQINQAIKDKIASVSKQPESIWETRIPDLYNPMEFYVLPFWDKTGVQNKTAGGSLYSPITDYQTALVNPQKYFTDYSQDALIKSLQFLPSLYKSLNVAYIGALTNRNGWFKIGQIYPDVALIPSNDSQAAWMSDTTLNFLQQIENLISAAETLTPDNAPPANVKRVVKNNTLYAVMKIGSVNFMVVTRYQFVKDGVIAN